MADGFTAYEKGLEGKHEQAKDKQAATTKAPAKVIQTPPPQEDYWIPDCFVFARDQTSPLVYLNHKNITTTQAQDIQKAIAYVKQTPTGAALLKVFAQKKAELQIGAHFFSTLADYPYGDASPNESGHTTVASSIAATPIIIFVSVFLAKRKPECIADTFFHELVHVWFLATRTKYNEVAGTGHDPSASITIDPNCKKTYAGYDPAFQQQLQNFDLDLAKIPGAKICCE